MRVLIKKFMSNKQLVKQITTAVNQGKSKEEIYLFCLQQGKRVDEIERAFKAVQQIRLVEDKEEKRTVRLMLLIGVVLIGAGIFSFIASNWEMMGKAVKLLIIISLMLVSYVAGWYLKEKRNLRKTGEALILLGAIMYGAGIFLTAQIFNIRTQWPDGFILWMIGVVWLAYALENNVLYYLAVGLGVIALVGYPSGIFKGVILDSFLLTSSVLLLIAAAISFFISRVINKKIPGNLRKYY